MKPIASSAPGKVVLSGEYAVLHGAPAIVTAVDRRAHASVVRSADEWHRVSAPGFMEGSCDFRFAADRSLVVRPGHEAAVNLSLITAVFSATGAGQATSLQLSLDTRSFFHPDHGSKLGLGSSAAIATALTAALLRLNGDDRDVAKVAFVAHRNFQGGRGSGVDVAAATRGGIFAYRSIDSTENDALSWPSGLYWTLLWSGRPSNTAARVRKYLAFARGQPARATATRLASSAENVLVNWSGGSHAVLNALKDYTRHLLAFSVDHDLGIFDAGHGELHALAAGGRVVYKPCGAGGGDVGMALADDEGELMEFVERVAACGFERLNVKLDAHGVEVA